MFVRESAKESTVLSNEARYLASGSDKLSKNSALFILIGLQLLDH